MSLASWLGGYRSRTTAARERHKRFDSPSASLAARQRKPSFYPRLELLEDRLACSTVGIADASGHESSPTLSFTVTLSESSMLPVVVDYATANGSASAGSDYKSTTGTLRFEPGQTAATIVVPIIDDRRVEGSGWPTRWEAFSVNLSNASNATIADGQAIGVIFDNDEKSEGGPPCRRCLTAASAPAVDEPLTGTSGNYLFVADYDKHSILRFDAATGAFVDAIVPNHAGGLHEPL